MGYRGEDPSAHGDRGRQTPWQPSSGAAPRNAGAWDSDYGYEPDDGYPGQGQYPAPGQRGYGQPYEPHQSHERRDGYGPEPGQGDPAGYGPAG